MSLLLSYRAIAAVPVELEGIVPDRLRDLSLAEIERISIFHGNRPASLAELFAVSGDPSDSRIEFVGELSGVHYIGQRMTSGTIEVHGNVGRHVGAEMTGGRITVRGNVGDWAGAEMHGGELHITGSAGHWVGASYRGSKKGMTDGTIAIRGNAGDEIGSAMRRGTVAVAGSCGDAAGFSMVAGTILVFGGCGIRVGAGMKRGTIGLLGPTPVAMLPTFRRAGRFRPLFLRLLFNELARLELPFERNLEIAELELYHGDLLALGKGEVWMRAG
jgi:formylmethanofuran dehydrogenase subunit C